MSFEKVCINQNNKNNENNLINKSIPISIQKPTNSGYACSSWIYGSFHHSNPRFIKSEQPVKLIGEAQRQNKNPQNSEQPVTAQNLNKYGKRKLAENEKIVTEDFLKAMSDNKNIRGTSKKLNQNRSSTNLRSSCTNKNYKTEQHLNNSANNQNNENENNSNYTGNSNANQDNYIQNNNNYNNLNKNYNTNQGNVDTQQSYNVSGNNQDQRNRSRYSSAQKEREKEKNYKFGMTFEEWSGNKNKQNQVVKNLHMLKEHELKEYEKIEEKIEENYNKVK
jgi:hypothetical protein